MGGPAGNSDGGYSDGVLVLLHVIVMVVVMLVVVMMVMLTWKAVERKFYVLCLTLYTRGPSVGVMWL